MAAAQECEESIDVAPAITNSWLTSIVKRTVSAARYAHPIPNHFWLGDILGVWTAFRVETANAGLRFGRN